MGAPALLGFSDAAQGTALGVAWVVVLGFAIYRYRAGATPRRRFHLTVSIGAFWLAFSPLQVSTAVAGVVEVAIAVVAFGLIAVGGVAGIRWWRLRGAGRGTYRST